MLTSSKLLVFVYKKIWSIIIEPTNRHSFSINHIANEYNNYYYIVYTI